MKEKYCATFCVSSKPAGFRDDPLVYLGMHGNGMRPLTPAEARQLAELLERAADDAEGQ